MNNRTNIFSSSSKISRQRNGNRSERVAFRRRSKHQRKDKISFDYWLFDSSDILLKISMAIGVAFTILTLSITFYEFKARDIRNQAYNIITSNQSLNYEEIMDAAELFFRNESFVGFDERIKKVQIIYEDIFSKWFIEENEITKETLQQRLNILKQIKD